MSDQSLPLRPKIFQSWSASRAYKWSVNIPPKSTFLSEHDLDSKRLKNTIQSGTNKEHLFIWMIWGSLLGLSVNDWRKHPTSGPKSKDVNFSRCNGSRSLRTSEFPSFCRENLSRVSSTRLLEDLGFIVTLMIRVFSVMAGKMKSAIKCPVCSLYAHCSIIMWSTDRWCFIAIRRSSNSLLYCSIGMHCGQSRGVTVKWISSNSSHPANKSKKLRYSSSLSIHCVLDRILESEPRIFLPTTICTVLTRSPDARSSVSLLNTIIIWLYVRAKGSCLFSLFGIIVVMQTTGEGGGELEREVLVGRGSCLFSIPFCAAAYTHKTSSIYVYEPQPYHIQVLWVNSHFLDKNCINNILSITHSFTAQQHIHIKIFWFFKNKTKQVRPLGVWSAWLADSGTYWYILWTTKNQIRKNGTSKRL